MPSYRIESGALDVIIETAFPAKADMLVMMAIDRTREEGPSLSVIASVTGGAYVGDNEMYVSVCRCLEKMGGMEPTVTNPEGI